MVRQGFLRISHSDNEMSDAGAWEIAAMTLSNYAEGVGELEPRACFETLSKDALRVSVATLKELLRRCD